MLSLRSDSLPLAIEEEGDEEEGEEVECSILSMVTGRRILHLTSALKARPSSTPRGETGRDGVREGRGYGSGRRGVMEWGREGIGEGRWKGMGDGRGESAGRECEERRNKEERNEERNEGRNKERNEERKEGMKKGM